MTWQSWAWIAWAVAFGVVELTAILQKDRPKEPRTLTANLRWLVQPVAGWHMHARWLFIVFLAWLHPHILGH